MEIQCRHSILITAIGEAACSTHSAKILQSTAALGQHGPRGKNVKQQQSSTQQTSVQNAANVRFPPILLKKSVFHQLGAIQWNTAPKTGHCEKFVCQARLQETLVLN